MIEVSEPRKLSEYEMRELGRIATEWQDKNDEGEMPDVVYKALHGDTDQHNWVQKKVVESLGRYSIITNADGTLCDWEEIKSQWRYDRSLFHRYGICMACNKLNIVEHCILKNKRDGREITVGNECVFNFIKIVVDGVELSGDEKREFLRDQMNEAKRIFKAQQFRLRYPNIMDDLEELRDLDDYYGWKLRMKAIRRLQKYGYFGQKMEDKFLDVRSRADELRSAMNAAIDEKKREEQERQKKAAKLRQEREAKRRHDIAVKKAEEGSARVGYSPAKAVSGEGASAPVITDPVMREAHETFESMKPYLRNDWEKKFVRDNATRLAQGKKMSVRQKEIWDGIVERCETTTLTEDSPMVETLDGIDTKRLTAWERNFVKDMRQRFATGSTLDRMSPKQKNMLRKVIRKGDATIPAELGEEE